jgi:hypothetical protein
MNYRLSKKIQYKLFHGIVIPTGTREGYTMADHNKVTNMMNAVTRKYHSLSKEQRKMLIGVAEKNIQDVKDNLVNNETTE